MSGLDTAGKGRASMLPPIAEIAAEIRNGTPVDDLCAQHGISRSTMQTRFHLAGYTLSTGEPVAAKHNRPAALQSAHIGAGGQHVGGGDYQGLPTTPVRYSGRPKTSTIDWDQITENYVARGGQVDASVWPNHGKVVVIGGTANSSRANIHTFTEAEGDDYEYDNSLAQPAPERGPRRRNEPLLSEADQRKVARRYRAGESIRSLGEAFNVTTSAIQTALRHQHEPTRSRNEMNRRRTRSAS